MKWIHVDFWFLTAGFTKISYLNPREQKDFERILAEFIGACRPYINRKFYLYEDIPHCFLALELMDPGVEAIEKLIKEIKAPYIYKVLLNDKHTYCCGDESNGEGFLNIMDAFTELYLFKRDNAITHVIHCCMEFMLQSRVREHEFYKKMAIMYQPVKIKNKKVIYQYKSITPRLRQKLLKYADSLDLRKDKNL